MLEKGYTTQCAMKFFSKNDKKVGNFMGDENDQTAVDINNIKKIWILKTVLDIGSFRKAAQILKITPSAISQNLKSLESNFNKPLVIRQKDGSVASTDFAKKLIENCDVVFSAFNQVNVDLKSESNNHIDYIELGICCDLSFHTLPMFFKGLKKDFPELKVKVVSDRNHRLLQYLKQGKLCSVLMLAEPSLLSDFHTEPIKDCEMGFYISKLRDEGKSLEEVLKTNKDVAMLTRGEEGIPVYLSRFLNQFPFKIEPNFLADSYELLSQVTAVNSNVALLPKYIGENHQDLVELKSENGELKETGKHSIFLVSEQYCDKKESAFLADELRKIWP